MPTNFFERQDKARQNTKRLIFYFILAVIAIISSASFVIWAALKLRGYEVGNIYVLFSSVSVFTIGVVVIGSASKIANLSGGGQTVAEHLGGKQIHYDSGGLVEKRLINVVQEMALASGVPAPPVYILEESGINAFAAGFSPDDAVIAVTRGAAERLSRSELQGVIAHEFSHILNGDMRLNIRLMGVIHGILVLGIMGYYLFYMGVGGHHHHRHYFSSSRRKRYGGHILLILMGLGLMVVGYVGTFFGNLIKSAVNRQREYLADASAVQFTRYPDGLAGALMTIGGYAKSSRVSHENAEEARHMFFGEAVSDFRTLFSTHPPLEERIKRLKPEWEGSFPESAKVGENQLKQELQAMGVTDVDDLAYSEKEPSEEVASAAEAVRQATEEGFSAEERTMPDQELDQKQDSTELQQTDVETIGQPSGEHLAYAHQILNELPDPLREALHAPYEARALVYSLLIHPNEHDRDDQIDLLNEELDTHLKIRTKMLLKNLEETSPRVRLPLLELALQELRSMSEQQTQEFLNVCKKLMNADDKVELFEWSLYTILRNALTSSEEKKEKNQVEFQSLEDVNLQVQTVLSQLAVVGHESEEEINEAFQKGIEKLDLSETEDAHVRIDELDVKHLRNAVETIRRLADQKKEQVIRAFVACVRADDKVTIKESELLRAVCELLNCPMPPILSETGSNSNEAA